MNKISWFSFDDHLTESECQRLSARNRYVERTLSIERLVWSMVWVKDEFKSIRIMLDYMLMDRSELLTSFFHQQNHERELISVA